MAEWKLFNVEKLQKLTEAFKFIAEREVEQSKNKIENIVKLARIKNELAKKNVKGTDTGR